MGVVQRSSTTLVEEQRRVAFWNSGSHVIGGIDARPIGGGAFRAQVAMRRMGALIVYALDTGPHRVAWSRKHIERAGEPFVRMRFQRAGTSVIEQDDGTTVRTRPGEWSMIDGSRPHAIVNEEDNSTLSLQIPRSQLPGRLFDITRRIGGPHPIVGGIPHMLFECLRLAVEELDEERESVEEELGASILSLFQVMLNAHVRVRPLAASREIAESRIRSYIRRHLSDPDLSVDKIAAAMNCSRRYIHKLFQGGETVTQYIWSQRLEACRRQIQEFRDVPRTLTQIALDCGFRSPAHFSRAFRSRFGVTPSEFRAMLQKEQPHPQSGEAAVTS
jgi:AraC-like DNA-binding protein